MEEELKRQDKHLLPIEKFYDIKSNTLIEK